MNERIRGFITLSVCWLFSILYWSVYIVLCTVTLRSLSFKLTAPLAHFWGNAILWILGIEVDIQGAEQLKTRESRIIVTNHQSALDVPLVACVIPPATFGIGKKELLYIPFFNHLWWCSRSFFIDRKNRAQALRELKAAACLLDAENCSVVIAPEGTRTRDGKLGKFKKGAFHLAIDARAPISPVVIDGGFQLMPKGQLWCRRGKLVLRCLEPIDTTAWQKDWIDQHVEDVWQIMNAELQKMRGLGAS